MESGILIDKGRAKNMFWVELLIVLVVIFIGVRVGGTFMAMAGGVGMLILTFVYERQGVRSQTQRRAGGQSHC